uniref:THAP domain-containing protein 9 n=1 Tax=Caligus clemensi TaxID=344056 RepID=C1C072_CALCM|nr:THAP domain-containing protein 9 [Caligus clemensi]
MDSGKSRRKTCAVSTCSSPHVDYGYSYHRFPKRSNVRDQWIKACRRIDKINPDTATVCSKHFEQECFEQNLKAELMANYGRTASGKVRKTLKANAVPTLHLRSSDPSEGPVEDRSKTRRKERITARNTKKMIQNLIQESEMETSKENANVASDVANKVKSYSSVSTQADIHVKNKSWMKEKKELLRTISRLKNRIIALERIKSRKVSSKAQVMKTLRFNLSQKISPSQASALFSTKAKARPQNWSDEEIQRSLVLRSLTGERAYSFILNNYPLPLPALSTLRKYRLHSEEFH